MEKIVNGIIAAMVTSMNADERLNMEEIKLGSGRLETLRKEEEKETI